MIVSPKFSNSSRNTNKESTAAKKTPCREKGGAVMRVSRYCHPVMKQLTDQQVRYAPREVRITQMKRAEGLISDIDPSKSYPYREICERITNYRPELYPDLVIGGQDAVHDLRCFVEDLSDSTDLEVAHVDEPVLTVDEISQRYNVSTKTVD